MQPEDPKILLSMVEAVTKACSVLFSPRVGPPTRLERPGEMGRLLQEAEGRATGSYVGAPHVAVLYRGVAMHQGKKGARARAAVATLTPDALKRLDQALLSALREINRAAEHGIMDHDKVNGCLLMVLGQLYPQYPVVPLRRRVDDDPPFLVSDPTYLSLVLIEGLPYYRGSSSSASSADQSAAFEMGSQNWSQERRHLTVKVGLLVAAAQRFLASKLEVSYEHPTNRASNIITATWLSVRRAGGR